MREEGREGGRKEGREGGRVGPNQDTRVCSYSADSCSWHVPARSSLPCTKSIRVLTNICNDTHMY